jgi:hypothetical protein
MKSKPGSQKPEGRRKGTRPGDCIDKSSERESDAFETPAEDEETDLEDSDLEAVDDDRWDVFILDDDSDPLPAYGDFWFPD